MTSRRPAVALAATLLITACGAGPSAGPGVLGHHELARPAGPAPIDGDGTGRRGEAGAGGPSPFEPGPRPDDLEPVRFGIALQGADPAAIAALEAEAGAEVGVVRVFARWDTPFPNDRHRALLEAGRTIHLSVRPRTEDGRVIAWADLVRAEPGSTIHDELTRWATTVAGYGSQLYFTFNHEPETRDSAANGTAPEYRAAWRRAVEVLRANGGADVRTVFVLGRGAYADGRAEDWYPGDDVVDVIGADPYNWYRCQGTDRPWVEPRELIEPPLRFARDRGKRLALPEIASTEDPDDPDRKARWIVELARTVGSADIGPDLEFVAWFGVHDRSWPQCRWEYDSSPSAAAAFAATVSWFERP